MASELLHTTVPSAGINSSDESNFTGPQCTGDGGGYPCNASVWGDGTATTPSPSAGRPVAALTLKVATRLLVLVVTLLGNALVIRAYTTTRKLRTYTNYYIVSLAVADLIGGGVLPVKTVYLELSVNWTLGEGLCAALTYLDHVFIQATFLLTLAICYDRFRAFNAPLRHLKEKTAGHACRLVALCFLVPTLIWLVVLIVFPYSGLTTRIRPPLCHGTYAFHPTLLIFTVLVLSWIPMITTTVLYLFVYSAIIRRRRGRTHTGKVAKRRRRGDDLYEFSSTNGSLGGAAPRASVAGNGRSSCSGRYRYRPDAVPARSFHGVTDSNGKEREEAELNPITPRPGRVRTVSGGLPSGVYSNQAFEPAEGQGQGGGRPAGTAAGPSSPSLRTRAGGVPARTATSASKREGRRANLRATRTLTYILVIMIVSALPWSVFAMWGAVSPYTVPLTSIQFNFLGWMVHLSSAANPFCYAICNPLFKRAFVRILCRGRWSSSAGGDGRSMGSSQST